MQLVAACITIFLSLSWCNAIRGKEVLDHEVDSIYQTLTPSEKAKNLVWFQVKDQNQIPDPQSINTLYLTSNDILFKDQLSQYNKVLQLDESLNPGSDDPLPGLNTLAAITDDVLLNKYFEYLKELGLSEGYQYLILPSTENTRMATLLGKLQAFDPNYFIDHELLFFHTFKKKKQVRIAFEKKDFWIVDSDEFPDAMKIIDKVARKLPVNEKKLAIKYLIRQYQYNQIPVERPKFSKELDRKMKEASVALLEQKKVLPLTQDTLCFITNDPYGKMAGLLRNYAYLLTSLADIVNSQAPIVADHSPLILPDLGERTMIYLGPVEQLDENLFDAALITPSIDSAYYVILSQQLYGVKSISGVITNRDQLLGSFTNATLEDRHILGYAPPEYAGLSMADIDSLTQIIEEGISQEAFPGCQLAIAYKGVIIHDQSYGYLTYDKLIPVSRSTIYDLASVTKVAGTLQAVMQLYDQHKIDLDQPIARYLPGYIGSNKQNITLKALLSHQAGLLPYVPFWKRALTSDYLEPFYYSPMENQLGTWSFGLKPYLTMKDSMSNWILRSPLLRYDSVPYYSYSDIGFMILQEIVEAITHQPLDQYLNDHIYQPLCFQKTTFNPLKQGVELYEIAPTEFDQNYRGEQIWGKVHDRNAALLNGVGGHAGLFSNADDLLVLMQMILQGGSYADQQFFDAETARIFNQRYFEGNRRALGWDKKDELIGNVSLRASDQSFGHTGFTGTMVWADPEYDLVFVFLTNRIHPDSNNRKLIELDIRTRIQDVVYKAIQGNNSGQEQLGSFWGYH